MRSARSSTRAPARTGQAPVPASRRSDRTAAPGGAASGGSRTRAARVRRDSRRGGRSSARTWPSASSTTGCSGRPTTRVAESSTSATLDAAVERIVAVKERHTRVLRGGGAAAADGVAAGRAAGAPRAPPHGVAARRRRARPRTSAPGSRGSPSADAEGDARAAELERGIAALPGIGRAHGRDRPARARSADARPDYMEQAGRGTRGVRHRQVHRDLRQRALGRPRPRGRSATIRCPPPPSARCGTWPTSSTTRSATPATC